jgi:repressor of nif and glnA expression
MNDDKISELIIEKVNDSNQPLETKEILDYINERSKNITHSMILYRLMNLRGDGEINGKRISAGAKGVWIWWRKDAFEK